MRFHIDIVENTMMAGCDARVSLFKCGRDCPGVGRSQHQVRARWKEPTEVWPVEAVAVRAQGLIRFRCC
jgi:hypothetical protein